MASRKGMNLRRFLILVPVAALLLVLVVFAAIWFQGTRYISIETAEHGKAKFIGKLGKGGQPSDGTVYYSDGSKAVLTVYDQPGYEFRNGSNIRGELYELHYDDKSVYIGELTGLLRDGRGSLLYAGGDLYEGDFYYGELTGEGSYYYKNGDVYVGGFKNGVKSGSGCYTWTSIGESYEGEYQNNLRHGNGVYRYAGGDIYSGGYDHDAKSGQGKMVFASGDVYEGSFSGDLRSGKGKYTFASGDVYEGDFYRDTITGYGTYHWANGERADYSGYFENGVVVTVLPQPTTEAAPTSSKE